VKNLLQVFLFFLVKELRVFQKLSQVLAVSLDFLRKAIRQHFHGIDGERLVVLSLVLVLHGFKDALGELAARIRDTDSAAALTDERLDGDEDALRLTCGLLHEAAVVELVERLPFTLLGLRLQFVDRIPHLLITQG